MQIFQIKMSILRLQEKRRSYASLNQINELYAERASVLSSQQSSASSKAMYFAGAALVGLTGLLPSSASIVLFAEYYKNSPVNFWTSTALMGSIAVLSTAGIGMLAKLAYDCLTQERQSVEQRQELERHIREHEYFRRCPID